MGGESPETIDRLGKVAVSIVADFEQGRSPFGGGPEAATRAVDGIDDVREVALFFTLAATLTRGRDPVLVWPKARRLREEEPWLFEPTTLVTERDYDDLRSVFEREDVGFGRRDAKAWYEIADTLHREYDADPTNLLEAFGYDLHRLDEYVTDAAGETRFFDHGRKFPVLRGETIRPLWLRLMGTHVHPLGRATDGADPALAVDAHLLRLTNGLLGRAYEDSDIDRERVRRVWARACAPYPVEPVEIDGPLWYVDRHWDEWGRAYLQSKLYAAGLELREGTESGRDERSVPG